MTHAQGQMIRQPDTVPSVLLHLPHMHTHRHTHTYTLCLCTFTQAFVQFVDVPSAQRAKDAISGRMFAGNIVNAFFIGLPTYQAAM
jgi:hypothetical protein